MVTTTVSGLGWATSMLPPPVWVQPWRMGVTCPCLGPRMMDTVGVAGAAGVTVMVTGVPGGTVVFSWAASAAGRSTPARAASRAFWGPLFFLALFIFSALFVAAPGGAVGENGRPRAGGARPPAVLGGGPSGDGGGETDQSARPG